MYPKFFFSFIVKRIPSSSREKFIYKVLPSNIIHVNQILLVYQQFFFFKENLFF